MRRRHRAVRSNREPGFMTIVPRCFASDLMVAAT